MHSPAKPGIREPPTLLSTSTSLNRPSPISLAIFGFFQSTSTGRHRPHGCRSPAQNAACGFTAIPVSRKHHEFGVIETSHDHRILAFHERSDSPSIPGDPRQSSLPWATILRHPHLLKSTPRKDAADEESSHDFGRDILPKLVAGQHAIPHDCRRIKPDRPAKPQLTGAMSERSGLLGSQHGSAFGQTGVIFIIASGLCARTAIPIRPLNSPLTMKMTRRRWIPSSPADVFCPLARENSVLARGVKVHAGH